MFFSLNDLELELIKKWDIDNLGGTCLAFNSKKVIYSSKGTEGVLKDVPLLLNRILTTSLVGDDSKEALSRVG